MNKINNNGMSHEVVAANNSNNNQNNNIETLMGMIIAGHDGAKDYGYAEYGRDWFVNYGDYTIYINRCYGLWGFSIYKNYKSSWSEDGMKVTYDDKLTSHTIYIKGKWSKTLVVNMAKFILDTIADYEQEQEEIRMEEEWEKMDDCVAEFQPIFEDYVQDLRYVADNYGKLSTKCDCFAAKEIVKKIKDLGETLLRALGNITECSMVEEDGHWLDTSRLEEWYCDECGRLFYDDFMHLSDIEDLIDALDYMITESDMPLGLDEEDLEYINEGGCYCFDGYPMYLWQDLREFVATYYHYAYCA